MCCNSSYLGFSFFFLKCYQSLYSLRKWSAIACETGNSVTLAIISLCIGNNAIILLCIGNNATKRFIAFLIVVIFATIFLVFFLKAYERFLVTVVQCALSINDTFKTK